MNRSVVKHKGWLFLHPWVENNQSFSFLLVFSRFMLYGFVCWNKALISLIMQTWHFSTQCYSANPWLLIETACVCVQLFSSHSPVPTITWRKINGNIPKRARLRKSQAVLEIPNIQQDDSGVYECKAENPRGGTAFKGHLQVYSESHGTSRTKENRFVLFWKCGVTIQQKNNSNSQCLVFYSETIWPKW